MERVRPAPFVGLPLLVLGWLGGHELAYGLVGSDRHLHGYLAHAPLLVGTCAAVALAGIVARACGLAQRQLPLWAVVLAPASGFAVQEHVERALQADGIPWGAALEPVFLIGLLLQAPFALAAALLARALTAVADAVTLVRRRRARTEPLSALPLPKTAELRPVAALAAGHAGREPPLPA
jgi:hypothetical protein